MFSVFRAASMKLDALFHILRHASRRAAAHLGATLEIEDRPILVADDEALELGGGEEVEGLKRHDLRQPLAYRRHVLIALVHKVRFGERRPLVA